MTQWMLDTWLATTVLMLLVLFVRPWFGKAFGARAAYMLWLLPAARLFMPAVERPAPPVDPEALLTGEGAAHMTGSLADPVLATIGLSASNSAAADGALSGGIDWTAIVIALWLGGAAFLFLSRLAAFIQFRSELLADSRQLGRRGGIAVVESPEVAGPVAFGIFARYIVVPLHFERDYSRAERDLALAHELEHHRAGDLVANMAGFAFLCLHWFNPVAWAAWRAFRFDQEAACDARVLARRSLEDRSTYGRTLAKSASGGAIAFASPMNSRKTIKERLKKLKSPDTSPARRVAGMLATGSAVALALPLTATVTYAEPDMPGEDFALAEASGIAEAAADRADLDRIDAVRALSDPTVIPEVEIVDLETPEAPLAPAPAAAPLAPRAPAPPAAPAPAARASAVGTAHFRNANYSHSYSRDGDSYAVSQTVDRGTRKIHIKVNGKTAQRLVINDCTGKSKGALFMREESRADDGSFNVETVRCGDVMPDRAEIMAAVHEELAEAREEIDEACEEVAEARATIAHQERMNEQARSRALANLDRQKRQLERQRSRIEKDLRRELARLEREWN